jgi:YD repeat-containing protein
LRIDFVYDGDNRLTGETRYSDLAGTTKVATTSLVYDTAGNLTSQIDKDGSGTNIANYTNIYDANGRITSEQLNGAARTTYAYDVAGQVTGDGHFTRPTTPRATARMPAIPRPPATKSHRMGRRITPTMPLATRPTR